MAAVVPPPQPAASAPPPAASAPSPAAASSSAPSIAPEKRQYTRYDSGVSNVPDTEAADIEEIRNLFTKLVGADYEMHGHTYPVTHAKTLGIVKGKLIVPSDLPSHLKQSFFAKPGEYPVILRYATNSHDVSNSDSQSSSRAVSMKIFGVDGDRFPEGAGNRTQDFILNSSVPVSELSNARNAKELIGLFIRVLTDPAGAGAELQKRPDAPLVAAPTMVPKSHVEALTFYSQTPYRFGDYVAKHAIFPDTLFQQHLLDQTADPKKDPHDVMRVWLKEFYAEHQAVYTWKFQLLENIDDQPVEYAGKVWDPTKYPFQPVAKLVFPRQDSFDYDVKAFWEDEMRANIWRGLKTLEPLGGTNRVRRVMYPYAGKMREKLNSRQVKDVQSIEDIPGPIPEGAKVQPPSILSVNAAEDHDHLLSMHRLVQPILQAGQTLGFSVGGGTTNPK